MEIPQKTETHVKLKQTLSRNICKNVSKNLSGKCSPDILAASQKLLDQAKQSLTDSLKTASKTVIQKVTQATGDLMSIKLLTKIQKS